MVGQMRWIREVESSHVDQPSASQTKQGTLCAYPNSIMVLLHARCANSIEKMYAMGMQADE
jgi:hypothetical protein